MHYGEFGVAKKSLHHVWYLLTSGEVDLGIWGVTLQAIRQRNWGPCDHLQLNTSIAARVVVCVVVLSIQVVPVLIIHQFMDFRHPGANKCLIGHNLTWWMGKLSPVFSTWDNWVLVAMVHSSSNEIGCCSFGATLDFAARNVTSIFPWGLHVTR